MLKKLITFSGALALAFWGAGSFSAGLYANVSDLQKKQTEIKGSTQQVQQELNSTKQEKSAVLLEVEAIDDELQQVTAELEFVTDELEKTEALLERTVIELANAEAERETQYGLLKLRLRRMYEDSGDGYLTYVLKAGSISDLLNRIEYVNRIATYDKELIRKLRETEALIALKLKELKGRRKKRPGKRRSGRRRNGQRHRRRQPKTCPFIKAVNWRGQSRPVPA